MINTVSYMGEVYFTEHLQVVGISWCNQVNHSYLQVSTRKEGSPVSHTLLRSRYLLMQPSQPQLSPGKYKKHRHDDGTIWDYKGATLLAVTKPILIMNEKHSTGDRINQYWQAQLEKKTNE